VLGEKLTLFSLWSS